MSRGYVVRGKYADGGAITGRYVNLDEAAGYRAERMRWGATEATIYAVAEDGTETPLPTYEEALEQLATIGAATPTSIVPTHSEHGDPLPAVERVRVLATEAAHEAEGATALAVAKAEIERLRGIVDHARRLIRSSDGDTSNGERVGLACDQEPFDALSAIFEAEREAERTIPGLVCAECDRPIHRGSTYAGRTGNAAHTACRNWPAGTVFRKAGAAREGME